MHVNRLQRRILRGMAIPPRYAGTGQQVGSTQMGMPGSKERVGFGQTIGSYVDPTTGTCSPTTNGIVHYGGSGIHVVPARP
jgi:filamentous hemagglutinin